MRRSFWSIASCGLGLTWGTLAQAGPPPALPDPGADEGAPATDTADPAPGTEAPTGPGSAEDAPPTGAPGGGPTGAPGGETPGTTPDTTGAGMPAGSEPDVGLGATGAGSLGAEAAGAGLETTGPEVDDSDLEADDDPGMVRGRREPMALTQQGPIGLFYTSLPDVGGKYTFRFRVHTDFFRKQAFIYESSDTGADEHARVRGGIHIGFTPFRWAELFWGVRSQANRNTRDQEGREDPETVFALGDMDFGLKAAHRFKDGGIGFGGQLGLGLLSGTERLLTSKVNFWFDALFAVDLRYLTKKNAPVRLTTNIGWILDNSLDVVDDWAAITDATSREVNRFSLGVNHSRVRFRLAVDFPIRFGKERQAGIDPILEWAWDIATTEDTIFKQDDATASPLPRSSQWITIGLRANPVAGLILGVGADIGLVSPNFENGPPVPPWQVILGIGWSVDPNPEIKEVEVAPEVTAPPPAVLDGRILGQVVGSDGAPVANAKVSFPGVTTNAILTDESGSFTSFRFPAGVVQIQVEIADKVVYEGTADVRAGEDTNVSIQLETPAVTTGIVQGTFTNDMGQPIKVSMKVTGQGVDEAFESTEGGLIALELYAGDYSAVLSAPGYKEKSITFTVEGSTEIPVKETLASEKPPETPNIKPSRTRIRIKKKIRYSGTDIKESSFAILDELAVFLKYHPEYELVEVEVHTDDRGNPTARSSARAEAVRTFLVNKGVESERLDAKGYGDKRPVAVNMTASGRAQNNRTYFRVKRMK